MRFVERRGVGRQQLEPVVVGGEGERDRAELRDPIGEERGQPFVHQPPLDRIEEEVVALARLDPLDQQLVGAREAADQRPCSSRIGRTAVISGPA